MDGAQAMAVGARRLAGDPLALARCRGDATVERARELEVKERPAFPDAQEEAGIDLGRRRRTFADLDRDAGRRQTRMPLPLYARIGILEGRDDAADAGLDQGVGTGRRPAVMRARLQRDVDGGAFQGLARIGDRLGLGVRPAAVLRAAARDHAAIAHDHAADGRIGPGAPERTARQR